MEYQEWIELEAAEARREHNVYLKERFLPPGPSRFDEIVSKAREACRNEAEVVGYLAESIVMLERELQQERERTRA